MLAIVAKKSTKVMRLIAFLARGRSLHKQFKKLLLLLCSGKFSYLLKVIARKISFKKAPGKVYERVDQIFHLLLEIHEYKSLPPWNIPLSHLLRQETCTVRVYRLMSSHARDSSVERRKAPTFEVLHKSAQAWIVPTCTTTTTRLRPFGGVNPLARG